jgi:RNA polymerase sigma-70 factor (ECF subfamily)
MAMRPSPIVALNRAIAIAQCEGPERGLDEIEKTADRDRLATYPFHFAALGELEFRRGRTRLRASTFVQHSLRHAIRWSADYSRSE